MARDQKRVLALVGRRIRGFREAAHMTQKDVARAAAVDAKYFWGVERGRRNVTLHMLDRIAKALDVQPWQLLQPMTGKEARASREVDRFVVLLERLEPEDRKLVLGMLERFDSYEGGRRRRP